MTRVIKSFIALALAHAAMPSLAQNTDTANVPLGAYPVNRAHPPDFQLSPDDGSVRHVPNSSAEYSLAETRDRFFAPDWHPNDHPRMPDVVARGRKPSVCAGGYCHRAEETGGPENSSLAGLPGANIVE